MEKTLTDIERQVLAEKASKLEDNEGLPVGFFLVLNDWDLRMFADDLSEDEWAESERNSDWIEELEDAKCREENQTTLSPTLPRAPSPFDAFASSDHRTADEMAADYVKSLEHQD